MGALTEKLRQRLRQYVTGDVQGFTQLHASEAERLAEGIFGEAMLHTIGYAHLGVCPASTLWHDLCRRLSSIHSFDCCSSSWDDLLALDKGHATQTLFRLTLMPWCRQSTSDTTHSSLCKCL